MKSQSFVHFLLSRFNVQIASDQPPCSDAWMSRRFELFKRYCLTSVRAQEEASFQWLVFLDSRTSSFWLEEFNKISDGIFSVVLINGVFTKEKVSSAVGDACCNSNAGWLMTTRMDMDDAISTDFLMTVQSEFRAGVAEIINVAQGYELGRNGETRWKLHSHNAWATLVEPLSTDPLTIWGAGHEDWKKTGINTRQVWRNARWMQSLHSGSHMSGVTQNSFRGIRVPREFVMGKFHIDSEYPSTRDGLLLWPWFVLYDSIQIIFRLLLDKRKRQRFRDLFIASK